MEINPNLHFSDGTTMASLADVVGIRPTVGSTVGVFERTSGLTGSATVVAISEDGVLTLAVNWSELTIPRPFPVLNPSKTIMLIHRRGQGSVGQRVKDGSLQQRRTQSVTAANCEAV